MALKIHYGQNNSLEGRADEATGSEQMTRGAAGAAGVEKKNTKSKGEKNTTGAGSEEKKEKGACKKKEPKVGGNNEQETPERQRKQLNFLCANFKVNLNMILMQFATPHVEVSNSLLGVKKCFGYFSAS
eukprot:5422922-Amphidinium_carterae.1